MRRIRQAVAVVVGLSACALFVYFRLYDLPFWLLAGGIVACGALVHSVQQWRGREGAEDPVKGLRRQILEQRLKRLLGRPVAPVWGIAMMQIDENRRFWVKFLDRDENGAFYDDVPPDLPKERAWLNQFLRDVQGYQEADKAKAWGWFRDMMAALSERGWLYGMTGGSDACGHAFLAAELGLRVQGQVPVPDLRYSNPRENVWTYAVNPGVVEPGLFDASRGYIEAQFGRVIIERCRHHPAMTTIRPWPQLPASIPLQPVAGRVVMGTDFIDDGKVCALPLDDLPHLLVMGTSGFGKSVFLHQLVSQFVAMPEVGKLFLIDLKGGVEFRRYQGRAASVRVVSRFEDVVGAVDEAIGEMERRLSEMVENGWRTYPKERMLFVVDEFAQVQLWPVVTKEEKAEKERLLANLNKLSMLGRAAGICIIAAIQKATTDVMDSSFRTNLQGQVCFRVSSRLAAASMFGSVDELKVDPVALERGRFIFYDAKSGQMRYLQGHVASEAIG